MRSLLDTSMGFFLSFFLLLINFYWSTVALLCCVSFIANFIASLHSKMHQPCIDIYPLPFGFPSHLGHHSALNRVPCAIQYSPLSCLFYTQYQQCICVNPNLPIPPTQPFPLGIHTFVRYVSVSISALQIGSSVPFFQIPHICIEIRYLFFSF